MKNYLPLGTGENRVEVIVQRWFQQHRQPTALGQIFNLDRLQSMIRPVLTTRATVKRAIVKKKIENFVELLAK